MSLTANDASSGFQKMGGKPLRAQMCKRESGNQERSPHVRIERSLEVPAPPLVEAPTAEKEAVYEELSTLSSTLFCVRIPSAAWELQRPQEADAECSLFRSLACLPKAERPRSWLDAALQIVTEPGVPRFFLEAPCDMSGYRGTCSRSRRVAGRGSWHPNRCKSPAQRFTADFWASGNLPTLPD